MTQKTEDKFSCFNAKCHHSCTSVSTPFYLINLSASQINEQKGQWWLHKLFAVQQLFTVKLNFVFRHPSITSKSYQIAHSVTQRTSNMAARGERWSPKKPLCPLSFGRKWKENGEKTKQDVSEVHVPSRQLIRRTVLIRRVAVKITVICRSCELLWSTKQWGRTEWEIDFGGHVLNF